MVSDSLAKVEHMVAGGATSDLPDHQALASRFHDFLVNFLWGVNFKDSFDLGQEPIE